MSISCLMPISISARKAISSSSAPFGLTVSPRATAAVEAAGAGAYGVASAMIQITRTIGMSVGLALLTSIGQNRIDELSSLIADPARRDELVRELGRPEFVGIDPTASLALVDLLEAWSQGQSADVLRMVIGIALGVAVLTILPAWFVRGRRDDQVTGSATITSSPQLRL